MFGQTVQHRQYVQHRQLSKHGSARDLFYEGPRLAILSQWLRWVGRRGRYGSCLIVPLGAGDRRPRPLANDLYGVHGCFRIVLVFNSMGLEYTGSRTKHRLDGRGRGYVS